ncbi:MAG: tRNA-dihydrouridine synthase family protein [Lachnospiraceae bacterium]|nr:tRNA-dihydrouridine synthase family protein [Lachnospiraceae bacterium]
MKYSLAPLEGITTRIYRNAVHDFFGDGIDRYYTPFLVVHEKRAMSSKEIKEVLPENNKGVNLIPQILADEADGFLRIDSALYDFDYREVNLNLGCPSKTVASKGRGSGFLGRLRELDEFLSEIFSGNKCDISIKTRIGESDPDEFEELLEIFNKYPVKDLIIHPRVRYEYYKGRPHRDVFYKAAAKSRNPVSYNGDIQGKADVDEVLSGCGGKLDSVMIGRGMIRDPSLIRQLAGGDCYTKEELKDFLKRLRMDYEQEMSGETPVLQKLKEIWSYMGADYDDGVNDLLKCRSLAEYKMLEKIILK